MSEVEAVLAKVAARRPRIIDLSLDRVYAALKRMGEPHRRLPPVIHIAGTNGKGSTIAYMKAILEASGARVHVYTSPHLVRFNERIVLAGEEISDGALIDALVRCDEAVGAEKLTYFETTTCAAFLAFSETPADYLLLETGLGGRLDATNVIETPLACVISAVDFDHEKFLGEKLEEIAAEKAGIFRAGTPAIIGPQRREVLDVLEQCAERIGARPYVFGRDWNVYSEHGRLVFQDDEALSDLTLPRLLGVHQIYNAGLGVAALRGAGLALDDETLSRGIKSAQWPARMQRLAAGPLIDAARALSSEMPEIWLDGGHNPSAARVIARASADLEEAAPKKMVLITAMQGNKNAEGYFTAFAGLAAEVFATSTRQDGAMEAGRLAQAARAAGLPAQICESPEHALRMALTRYQNVPLRILLGGSLYLAGEILKEHA